MPTNTDGRDRPDEGDLSPLERRLGAWRPAAGGLDRDRMLFEAGRASSAAEGRRLARTALAVAAVLAVAASGLGLAWERERSHRGRLEAELASIRLDATGHAPAPAPVMVAQRPGPLDPSSYLALARRISGGRLDLDRPPGPFVGKGAAAPTMPTPLTVGDRDRWLDL